MIALIFIAVIWMLIAPIIIINKFGDLEKEVEKSMDNKLTGVEDRLKLRLNEMRNEIMRLTKHAHSKTEAESPFVENTLREKNGSVGYGMSPNYASVSIPEASPAPALKIDLSAPVEAVPEAKHVQPGSAEAKAVTVSTEANFEVLGVLKDGLIEKSNGNGDKEKYIAAAKPLIESKSIPEQKSEESASIKIKSEPQPYKKSAAEYEQQILNKPAAEHEPKLFKKPAAKYEPEEPGILDKTLQKFWSWLLDEGNIWVCAGVILFLIGFGLLFNYAIQRGFLSLEMRLAGAAVTGLAMTGFGFYLRDRRRAYSLTLQGGGMGVLYLVVLAANQLSTGEPILSTTPAIIAMLILSVFTVLLALLQNYQPLAIFAILGGFAAPLLISTGSRDYIALFSIYTLLNFEILAISFKREWRLLSRLGFILTGAIGTVWGIENWSPELFSSIEPFLIIFLATYTLIALGIGRSKTSSPDILLAVAAPFSFFILQMQVVGHFKYGMALTCLGLGIWHLIFGLWMRDDDENEYKKERLALSRLYIFLCILFSNLVIPYLFDNTISAVIWGIEGAFLIIAACRTGSYKALIGGIALHAGALGLYMYDLAKLDLNAGALLSPIFVSGLLFSLSLLCSGFWTTRFRPTIDSPLYDKWEELMQKSFGDGSWVQENLSWVFTVLGALWWWGTFSDQAPRLDVAWVSLFSVSCLTAFVGSWMSVNFKWKEARFLLALPITLALAAMVDNIIGPIGISALTSIIQHIQINALIYLISIGGALYILREAEASISTPITLFSAILPGLYMFEEALYKLVISFDFGGNWAMLVSALPLLGLLFCLQQMQIAQKTHKNEFANPISYAIGVILLIRSWRFITSFLLPGSAIQGVFIPFLNPLELWQAVCLFSIILWVRKFVLEGNSFSNWPKPCQWGTALLFFVWFNQVAVRMCWHYWMDLPSTTIWSVFYTAQCQALIAIFWGVLGLLAILYGQKLHSRILWYAGAALLAADMIKLLLVDLSGTETIVRIVAFLALGGLSLLIGWVAPLPPREENRG